MELSPTNFEEIIQSDVLAHIMLLLTNNKESIQRVWCYDGDHTNLSAIWAVAAVCPQLRNVYSECLDEETFEEIRAAVPLHAKIDFPNIGREDLLSALSADDLRQADGCLNTPQVI